jgi:hypothetical protein
MLRSKSLRPSLFSAFFTWIRYDIELPLDVDDEYWDTGFVQPVGQPSQLAYFVCHLQLSEVTPRFSPMAIPSECWRQIMADAMRRLYGSKKSKILLGWDGPDWEQRAVADLDSAMNDFVDSIPLHRKSQVASSSYTER